MGEKDITEKILVSFPDVFADIVNGLLFQGQSIIKPEELHDQAPFSAYKADGMVRNIDRDVVKRWEQSGIRIACIGVENQSEPDPYMTLRVIGYDGTEYRAQMYSGKGPYYPVVTLVLNFDTRKPWNAPKSLYETFSIPDILKPYVQDYKINVFDIAFLTPDQVKLFKSDFRIIADYFVQKRIYGDYNPSPEDVEHMSAVLQLLSVMADDNRFVEVMNEAKKGDMKNMCDVLDRIEAKGAAKAREEVVVEMLTDGEPIKKIEKYSKLSESEIREIAAKLNLTVNEG